MADYLILLSGLPGTGKTRLGIRLSKTLRLPLLSKDRFQSHLRLQGLAGREGAEGYEMIFNSADQQLTIGTGAILDAVFPKRGFRLRARDLAESYGFLFKPIYLYCSSVEVLKTRMENREKLVPNWTPVGWSEVEKIRSYFEPWPEGSALELNAIDEFEFNFNRAIQWITNYKGAR
jgi:predicted kinase